MTARRFLVIPVAVAVAETAGCGAGSSSARSPINMPGMNHSPTSGTAQSHNQADVQFATNMISHHGQALVMANQVLSKTANPTVRRLALAIRRAQTPEITEISSWLRSWNQPVPNPTDGAMGMDMTGSGGMTMQDMMSSSQMDELAMASPARAARVFLTLMPQHHEGAIAMSRTELANGQNGSAKALARSIIRSQSAEIVTMRHMLRGLRIR